jgi:hypothetical protein
MKSLDSIPNIALMGILITGTAALASGGRVLLLPELVKLTNSIGGNSQDCRAAPCPSRAGDTRHSVRYNAPGIRPLSLAADSSSDLRLDS